MAEDLPIHPVVIDFRKKMINITKKLSRRMKLLNKIDEQILRGKEQNVIRRYGIDTTRTNKRVNGVLNDLKRIYNEVYVLRRKVMTSVTNITSEIDRVRQDVARKGGMMNEDESIYIQIRTKAVSDLNQISNICNDLLLSTYGHLSSWQHPESTIMSTNLRTEKLI